MYRPSSVALALALALAAAPAAAQTGAPPPGTVQSTPAPQQTAAPATVPPAPTAVAADPVVQPSPPPGGVLVPESGFRYDPTGRRDPFKSLLALEKKQRDLSQLPPIQQFDLEAAKVVGIVVDKERGPQAMVRAPNGQTFVARVGTIVGKNEGEVVEITLEGVRIVEKFLDFMNRETRKEIFLKSHPTAGK